MITVGAYEAKTNLSRLIDQVAAGEQVTITRHGAPVARLVPVANSNMTYAQAIQSIRELSVGVTLGGESILDMISEGRKY